MKKREMYSYSLDLTLRDLERWISYLETEKHDDDKRAYYYFTSSATLDVLYRFRFIDTETYEKLNRNINDSYIYYDRDYLKSK